jgi:hypothetical protein
VNVIDALSSGNAENLRAIYAERIKLGKEYSEAAIKARKAAVYLNRTTWSMHSMTYVNALLRGTKIASIEDSYITMVLISTIETFSFAQMGMIGLTYHEYNLAIMPIASIINPEMFQNSQTWTMQFIPEQKFPVPYYPEGYKKPQRKEIDLDPDGELDNLDIGVTPKTLKELIKTVAMSQTTKPNPSHQVDALEAMRKRMSLSRRTLATPSQEGQQSSMNKFLAAMREKSSQHKQ